MSPNLDRTSAPRNGERPDKGPSPASRRSTPQTRPDGAGQVRGVMRPPDCTSAPTTDERPAKGPSPAPRANARQTPADGFGRPDYAARVLTLRRARGWTQDDLADHLGLSSTTILRWESGHYVPRGPGWQRFLQAEQGQPVTGLSASLSAREARLAHIARELAEVLRGDLLAAGDRVQTHPVLRRRARLLQSAEAALARLAPPSP